MHICDIFHLHIEGVLSKRALAGRRNLSGSGQECRWTMTATLLETVLAATSHLTSAPWPDCLRSSLGSSVHNFSVSTLHLFSCPHTFVFAFLHNWEINDFKTNQVNPWWTLDVLMIQETVYHSDRPLGLLCVFCTQCAHVWVNDRWRVRGFESVLVAHNDTVQYSFRYLPMWRVTAWTEPWHGAKVMLYSVDNC